MQNIYVHISETIEDTHTDTSMASLKTVHSAHCLPEQPRAA